jgi:hypothetical protein
MPASPRSVLSVKQMAGAVEEAVKIAADRHRLQFEPQYTINGIINGRLLREAGAVDLNAVRQASEEITQHANGAIGGTGAAAAVPQVQLEAAVLIAPKYILCGYIPGPIQTIRFE